MTLVNMRVDVVRWFHEGRKELLFLLENRQVAFRRLTQKRKNVAWSTLHGHWSAKPGLLQIRGFNCLGTSELPYIDVDFAFTSNSPLSLLSAEVVHLR